MGIPIWSLSKHVPSSVKSLHAVDARFSRCLSIHSYSELTKSCNSSYVKIHPRFNIPFPSIHLSLSLTPKLNKQMFYIYITCFNIEKKRKNQTTPTSPPITPPFLTTTGLATPLAMSSTRFSGPWCVSRPWIFEGSNPKCCWKKCNSGPWPQPVMGLTVWLREMEHLLFFLVPGVKKSWGSKQKTNAASEMGFGLISFSECFNLKKLNSGFYQRRGSRFASFLSRLAT